MNSGLKQNSLPNTFTDSESPKLDKELHGIVGNAIVASSHHVYIETLNVTISVITVGC